MNYLRKVGYIMNIGVFGLSNIEKSDNYYQYPIYTFF